MGLVSIACVWTCVRCPHPPNNNIVNLDPMHLSVLSRPTLYYSHCWPAQEATSIHMHTVQIINIAHVHVPCALKLYYVRFRRTGGFCTITSAQLENNVLTSLEALQVYMPASSMATRSITRTLET